MKFLQVFFFASVMLALLVNQLYRLSRTPDDFPPKDPLPIDGAWMVDSSVWVQGNCKYQFDRGRAYILDCNGSKQPIVWFTEITLMPDGSYAAIYAPSIFNTKVRFEVISPTEIRSVGATDWIFYKIKTTPQESPSPSLEPKIGATQLDKDLKKVVLNQETISVPFGSNQTFTSGIQNKHSIDVSKEWNVNAGVKGEIEIYWARVSTEIKSAISNSTRSSDENSEEKKTSITLSGNDKPDSKYILRWIKYYKTGTVEMETKQGKVNVPFEVEDHPSIEAEKIN